MTPSQKRRVDTCVDQIKRYEKQYADVWYDILFKCNLRETDDVEKKEKDKTLEDLDPDDIDVIKKLTFQAMKDGLADANAQMVRASLVWQEQQAGKEALKGVSIEVTPATIPDDVGARLLPILEDLARSARDYQIRSI